MAIGVTDDASSFKRSANVPANTSCSIWGWFYFSTLRNGAFFGPMAIYEGADGSPAGAGDLFIAVASHTNTANGVLDLEWGFNAVTLGTVVANTWYFIALTASGTATGNIVGYIRDIATNTFTSVSNSSAGTTFTAGRAEWGREAFTGEFMDGRIHACGMADVALSVDELLRISFFHEPQLVGIRSLNVFYPTIEAANTTAVVDRSGNARDATATVGALVDSPSLLWQVAATGYPLTAATAAAPPPECWILSQRKIPGRGPKNTGRYKIRTVIDTFTFSTSYSLTCDPGAYALTGQPVGLPVGRTMAAAPGAYALTGQTVALARGRVLGATPGAYSLTGQAVALARGRVLAAAQGSYALTGQTVALARGRVLGAAQGSYALAGQAVALARGRVLAAAQGAYALTGQAVALARGRVLAAAQGAYALTGQAVTLTPTGSHSFTITAVQGAYVLTGQSVGLPVGRKMAAAQGSYALTGKPVGLSIARILPAAQGAYVLTGRSVGLPVGRKMAAAQGSYALTGQPIAERVARTLAAAPGAYALGGQAVTLTVVHANSRVLVCAPGAYALTGKPVVITVRRRISLGLGLYALTGQPVDLVFTASIFHGQLFHSRPEFLAMDRIVLQFFGETTQYFAGSGTPTQPRGVFFDPYTDVEVGTAEVQSVAPYVWYLLADLPADPQEIPPTAIIIRGKSYKPKEPQKDSDGGVKIELHLSS